MDDIPTDEPPASEGVGRGAETVRRPDGTVLRPVKPESEARGGAGDDGPLPGDDE